MLFHLTIEYIKVIKGFLHEKETDSDLVGVFDDIISVDVSHGYTITNKQGQHGKNSFPRHFNLGRKREASA